MNNEDVKVLSVILYKRYPVSLIYVCYETIQLIHKVQGEKTLASDNVNCKSFLKTVRKKNINKLVFAHLIINSVSINLGINLKH